MKEPCGPFLCAMVSEKNLPLYEYHYTLYYYDQSGNLVKTVPPKGVSYSTAAGTYPQHTLVTTYEYNSFNQVTRQTTPDAGTSAFWYDVLGRLVASQNAEQKNPLNGGSVGRYSYTFYDALGRIIEVGETVNQTGFTLPEMTDAISKDPVQLTEWKSKGIKTQITQTFYDAPAVGIVPHVDITAMQGWGSNRKRVVSTITRNSFADSRYQTATHYVYDITGNVRTLWQEVAALAELDPTTAGLKRIDYNYDLVSGKVNQVTYQKDKGDQFLYRYQYDAENRLTQATTSTDGLTFKTQAAYQYYLHGPLSRVELGEQVQATDYAYTLQGWMKYINGPVLHPEADMGNDGTNKNPTNFYFGRDVMAFGINYFAGDYTPIQNTPGNRFTNNFQLNSLPTGQPLYNGNISATLLALKGLNNNTTTGYTYLYDQLNRLLNTRQHVFGAASGSFMGNWTQSNTNITDNYAETFRYDANGNILQLNRNGNSQHPGGLAMDRLNYTYRDGTNQLWSVQDGIAAGAYAGDIDNQGGSNYSYDRIGNLIGDVSENISQVNWTVYGKIGNIQKKQAFLGYVYNAGGERVVKQYLPYATNQCLGCDENTGMVDLEVYERNSNTPNVYKASKTITFLSEYTDVRYNEYTAIIEAGLALCTPQCNVQPPLNTSDADIYIRDATGNVLAVYHYDRKTAQLRWSEQHLYGSSRLGMYQPEKVVTSVSTDSKQREVGYLGKQVFELSNHLGNVLATITDKKLQVSTNTTSTDYFEADVQTVQDYYAFGMQMPGRKLSGGYRYGFNGQEKSTEINESSYTAEFWQYDAGIGRRWNVDPIVKEFESPYSAFGNNPIWFSDIKGADTTKPNKVMIDPGHGDQYKGIKLVDPGAVSGTVYEKDITKNIGTSVNKYLSEFGVTSEMTRSDDKKDAGKRITWRLEAANAANADIFVSIHADATDNAKASGFHVIYQEANTNSANSKNLAESIAGVQTVMNLRGTGVDKDVRNLGVLREFNKKASVLIETGYITNASDKTILVTKADDIGKQIAIGIYKFINNGLPPSTPSKEKGIVKPIIGTVEIKRDGFINAIHEKMLRNTDFSKPLKKQ